MSYQALLILVWLNFIVTASFAADPFGNAPPPKHPLPPPTPSGFGLDSATTSLMTSPERISWDKTPISVTLTVGVERQLHFPKPVRIGLPPALKNTLRSQSVDNTVYWLAHAEFESTRILVREIEVGRTYLIDLRAVQQTATSSAPLEITAPEPVTDKVTPADTESTTPEDLPPSPGYVALTRFAAQQLYAPQRLVTELPGVTQTLIVKQTNVVLLRGGKVEAMPIAAWRSAHHFVTAVRLRNQTAEPVILDPRDLRGQWLTATFQHARLFPAGHDADTTCVYLISARPFEESR